MLIRFRDAAGGSGAIEEQIVDIIARRDAEYAKIGDGRDLLVDDLQEVGGVSFGDGPVVESQALSTQSAAYNWAIAAAALRALPFGTCLRSGASLPR